MARARLAACRGARIFIAGRSRPGQARGASRSSSAPNATLYAHYFPARTSRSYSSPLIIGQRLRLPPLVHKIQYAKPTALGQAPKNHTELERETLRFRPPDHINGGTAQPMVACGPLVRVGAFDSVLENLPIPGIDADLVGLRCTLYIEGVAQPAAALFLLQLLIGDGTGARLKCQLPRLCHRHPGIFCQPLAGISLRRAGPTHRHHAQNRRAEPRTAAKPPKAPLHRLTLSIASGRSRSPDDRTCD